jgi:hypothetical protein
MASAPGSTSPAVQSAELLALPARFVLLPALALLAALAGCTALLPKSQSATQAKWTTFEQAKQAIEGIVPHKTRRSDLEAMGIDPYTNPSVTILTYPDILQRFAAGSVITEQSLEAGIRDCLKAGKVCNGFTIDQTSVFRKRDGNFWADILGFRRATDVSGWHFSALIVMLDDLVVYASYGGQPNLHEREVSRNPLGPLQESGGSVIIRSIETRGGF